MSHERAERVIRSAYAARVEGDLDAIMTHFTETPHFSMAGSVAASPIPLTVTGAAAMREVMRRLVEAFDFVEAEIVDILRLGGDRIASMRQFTDTALAAELLES